MEPIGGHPDKPIVRSSQAPVVSTLGLTPLFTPRGSRFRENSGERPRQSDIIRSVRNSSSAMKWRFKSLGCASKIIKTSSAPEFVEGCALLEGWQQAWPSSGPPLRRAAKMRRSSDEVVGCFIAGHIGFSPDQIDQRRHADMAS